MASACVWCTIQMRAHVSCTGCCASDLFEAVQVVSWHHVRELVVAQGTDEKGEHLFLRGGTAAADSEGAACCATCSSLGAHTSQVVSVRSVRLGDDGRRASRLDVGREGDQDDGRDDKRGQSSPRTQGPPLTLGRKTMKPPPQPILIPSPGRWRRESSPASAPLTHGRAGKRSEGRSASG